jgi:hypothetical protein
MMSYFLILIIIIAFSVRIFTSINSGVHNRFGAEGDDVGEGFNEFRVDKSFSGEIINVGTIIIYNLTMIEVELFHEELKEFILFLIIKQKFFRYLLCFCKKLKQSA